MSDTIYNAIAGNKETAEKSEGNEQNQDGNKVAASK